MSIPKSVRSARQILRGDNDILLSLFNQSEALLRIESVISRHVDINFAVSSFKNKQLILVTTTGANATNLRYRQRNLISTLRQEGFEIIDLKIKVLPDLSAATPSKIERDLSPESARHLMSSAKYIEDIPLRQALITLSKRAL